MLVMNRIVVNIYGSDMYLMQRTIVQGKIWRRKIVENTKLPQRKQHKTMSRTRTYIICL